MRLGLDFSGLDERRSTGVERYAIGLERALAARADVEVVTLGRQGPRRRGPARRRAVAAAARTADVDLVHAPLSGAPTGLAVPVSRTVHDLGRLDAGEAGPLGRLLERRRLARAVPTVVPSRATRDALLPRLGRGAPAPVVIPHGLDEATLAAARGGAVARASGPPFVLVLGTVRPRRRPREIAALFARPDAPCSCLWAGEGAAFEGARGLRGLGRVDEARRIALLATCAALLVPSTVEGFALPALEAMAFGRPVIGFDLPVLRELGVPGRRLAPQGDLDALAGVLRAVLDQGEDDAHLDDRRRFALSHTWARSADAHLAFFRDLLG